MKKAIAIAALLTIPFLQTRAATPDHWGAALADTLRYSFHQQPRFYFNLVTFNSFISNDFVNFYGFRMGLQYNRRVKLGFGLFSLSPNSVVSPISVMEDTTKVYTNGNLEARYFSISAEYIFYAHYPWQMSVLPLDVAIGGAHYSYNSVKAGGRRLETPDVALVFYQPAVITQYSIVRWFGVAVSAGYRVTLFSSKDVREDFNAPGFSAGIKLFLDEAYKAVFPNGVGFINRMKSKDLTPEHSK